MLHKDPRGKVVALVRSVIGSTLLLRGRVHADPLPPLKPSAELINCLMLLAQAYIFITFIYTTHFLSFWLLPEICA